MVVIRWWRVWRALAALERVQKTINRYSDVSAANVSLNNDICRLAERLMEIGRS